VTPPPPKAQGRGPPTRPGPARPRRARKPQGLKQKPFRPPFANLVSTRARGLPGIAPATAERRAGRRRATGSAANHRAFLKRAADPPFSHSLAPRARARAAADRPAQGASRRRATGSAAIHRAFLKRAADPAVLARAANSTAPSRSRRSVLHLARKLREICSNRSAVAWGLPWRLSDDGPDARGATVMGPSSETLHNCGLVQCSKILSPCATIVHPS
jgi:hypothetical protein